MISRFFEGARHDAARRAGAVTYRAEAVLSGRALDDPITDNPIGGGYSDDHQEGTAG